MKRKIIFIIFCFLLGFAFCKEDQRGTYQGEDPNEGMDDPKLITIVNTGTEEQSQLALAILAEKERIRNLEKEISRLQGEINKIQSKRNGPRVIQSKKAQCAYLQSQLAAAKNNEKQLVKKAKKLAEDAINNQKAQKSGDPVNITNGSYEQTETDLVLYTGSPFEIKRRYDSANKITSSTGCGWYFTLDERIILGTAPEAQKVYDTMLDNINETKKIIDELKEDIPKGYKVYSLDTAVEEIEGRLSKCEPIKERAEELLTERKVRNQAESLLFNTNKKIEEINDLKEELEGELNTISELEADLAAAQAEATAYKITVLEPSIARHNKNKYVLFSGMDSFSEETGLDTLTVIDGDGYPHILTWNEENGDWEKEGEKTVRKCRPLEKGYEVTYTDGTVKLFDENGFVVKITDRNGNYVQINRNTDEKISSVETSFGEKFTFSYSGNYISKITNFRAADETVVYGYKGNKLSSVKDTDGDTVTMEYDQNGRMTELKKCDGSTVKIEYDLQDDQGNVYATATKNEEGYSEKFDYFLSDKKAEYTDHDGNKTTYWYDDSHRTKKEQRPDGTVIINEYDDKGNLKKQTENGNTVTFEYDDNGNKISARYSDNTAEYWEYDSYNQLLSYTDRSGVKTEYERDPKGNIKTILLNGTAVTEQTYKPNGQLLKRTVHGQKNIVTDYEYDDYGNLKSEVCGGVKTEYKYDKRNRVEKIYVAGKLITEYKYDKRKTIQKNYNGLETTYLNNGRKDLERVIQKDTVTGEIHETRIEYDKRHLPLKIYAGDGETEKLISSYMYSPEGKIRAEFTHGKEVWIKLYEYKNGSISCVKQYLIKDAASVKTLKSSVSENTLKTIIKKAAGGGVVQQYSYEIKSGNKKTVTITDALEITNLFEYDSFGNLVKTTDGSGEVRKNTYEKGYLKKEQNTYGGWYEYDYENGRMTKVREQGDSHAAETKYNKDGSISSQTDRYGKVTYYNYDSRGRVSSIQNEVKKVWYEYDSLDRIIKQVVGKTAKEADSVYYVTYEYSEDGRIVSVTEGGKYKTVSQMDAFGNVIKQFDGNANERSYVYDCQNQLAESSDAYGNKTLYEYNALGNIRSITSPDGACTEYFYNYLGFVEKISDDCGTVYTASYDKAGRLEKERSRADSEKTYKYDDSGRIKSLRNG